MTITGTANLTQLAAAELVRAAGLKLGHWDFRVIADRVNEHLEDMRCCIAEGDNSRTELDAETFFEWVCESPKNGDFENTPNIYGFGAGWPPIWRLGAR